jgi:hypothetical protein
MLGFKLFKTAAIIIAWIALMRQTPNLLCNLARLRLRNRRAAAVWRAVLAAR